MARPIKVGLDYFPLDVDFFNDPKVRFVRARFGAKGIEVTLRILCELYRDKGYYMPWDADMALLFADCVGGDGQHALVNDVVNELVRRGFFDKGILDRFSILTSKGIQRRYVEAKRKPALDLLCPEYSLLTQESELLDQKQGVSGESMPQSKVKESKAYITELFERFWIAYPRHIAKPKALAAFIKHGPDEALLELMLHAIERQRKTKQWQEGGGQFIPYPTTWLNQKRWEDEVDDPGSVQSQYEPFR